MVGIELEWILDGGDCVDKGTKAVTLVDSARIDDRSREQPIRLVKPYRLEGSHSRLFRPLVVPILIAIVVGTKSKLKRRTKEHCDTDECKMMGGGEIENCLTNVTSKKQNPEIDPFIMRD
jgi:hypothetical protein